MTIGGTVHINMLLSRVDPLLKRKAFHNTCDYAGPVYIQALGHTWGRLIFQDVVKFG